MGNVQNQATLREAYQKELRCVAADCEKLSGWLQENEDRDVSFEGEIPHGKCIVSKGHPDQYTEDNHVVCHTVKAYDPNLRQGQIQINLEERVDWCIWMLDECFAKHRESHNVASAEEIQTWRGIIDAINKLPCCAGLIGHRGDFYAYPGRDPTLGRDTSEQDHAMRMAMYGPTAAHR